MKNKLTATLWVILALSMQGCWADSSADNLAHSKSLKTEENVKDLANADEGEKDRNNKIEYEKFRELFVGSYQPASKGYFGQGELIITETDVTWNGCRKVPFRILKQENNSFYIELPTGKSCLYHGMNVQYMRFSIIYDGLFKGNFELNLYESKQSLMNNEFSTSGIMGRKQEN